MPDRKLLAAELEGLRLQLAQRARALGECEARYDAVFNSSMTYMSLCTAEGVVLDVSGSSLALGGVNIEDCVGRFVWEVPLYAQNPEEAAKVKAGVEAAAKQLVRYESRVQDADDQWWVFDVVIRPVRPQLGADARFLVFEGRDLTATRVAEDRARRAERMEALGLLTGGIAHDFNNFLTVAIGALDMVVRVPERPNRHALIEAALEAAQKAEALNKQLLAFARRAPIAAQNTDVGAALQSLAPLLKKAVGEAVELHLHSTGECYVPMEPAQFEAAILNLCVNARDAMPSGGVIEIMARPATPQERAAAGVQRQAVTVAVTDSGMGIDPEILPRVFDPFFTTKAAGYGTGLGLSQVYGFAQQSGGGVDVVSQPGRGSTFKLVLPCAPQADAAPHAAARSGQRHGLESALLVEDDESVAGVAAAMLSDLGLREVVTVTNGPEAQRELEKRSFDLLVTDVIMPGGLNGLQLAQWARAQRAEIKVLLFSGWIADALIAAPTDFAVLQKPFDLRALEKAIEDLA